MCNDTGKWGKGFVLAISSRWLSPEEEYRSWHAQLAPSKLPLGGVQFVTVEPGITVANMIGQHGVKSGTNGPPIRYEAIRDCLKTVAVRASELKATVHMPRIGCGLAGGEWSRIEEIIRGTLSSSGIEVTVYDLSAPDGIDPGESNGNRLSKSSSGLAPWYTR